MSLRKFQIIFVFLLVFVGILLFLNKPTEIRGVEIGGKTFSMEVARTKMEVERGLSLHVPLLDDQGMLFVFGKEDFYGFWMKDMLFPIDILWIDSDLKIVHVEKNLSPDTYPKVFYPKTKNLYVLEVSAGQADLLKINIGDIVKFIKR